MQNIILSIVIPTKDRYEYLMILLEALVSSESEQYEIIVHDNTEINDLFLDFLQKLDNYKIRYFHEANSISVVENFERAFAVASGTYVCFLGDDDGILIEESIELLKGALNNSVDSIVVKPLLYSWPDNSHAVWRLTNGLIQLNGKPKPDERIDIQKELIVQANKGFGFGLGKLPRVYQGFVLRSKINELVAECGTAFPGPSPDMANAVGLTKFLKNCIYTYKVCIISGHGKKSGGGRGSGKNHHGSIEHQVHLPKATSVNWSKQIPFFWSGPTIYAESARSALEFTNRKDIIINYNYLYAICLIFERKYKLYIDKTIRENSYNTKRLKIIRAKYLFEIMYTRGYNYLMNVIKLKLIKNFVYASDIKEAINKLKAKNA